MRTWFRPIQGRGSSAPYDFRWSGGLHGPPSLSGRVVSGVGLRVSSVLEGSPGATYPCSRPVAIVEVPFGRVAFRLNRRALNESSQ